jgi:hypothetical protein
MISGGNRIPANAERENAGIGRQRRDAVVTGDLDEDGSDLVDTRRRHGHLDGRLSRRPDPSAQSAGPRHDPRTYAFAGTGRNP